jgi:glycogen debranching enzyme
MASGTVSILAGNTFVVSDEVGDIEAAPDDPTGLFSFDTRFLSTWVLSVDGNRLTALSVDDLQYYESRFFLVPGTGSVYTNASTSIIRHRSVSQGFRETITVLNHDNQEATLSLKIDVGSDFADLFEVKDALKKKGQYYRSVDDGRLVLTYRRETFERGTSVSSSTPARLSEDGLSFDLTIPAHGEWSTTLEVSASVRMASSRSQQVTVPSPATQTDAAKDLEVWLQAAPTLVTSDDSLRQTYHRSLVDLAALRFAPRTDPDHSLPAAGLPWFMTIFGRDSIFTSLQALPIGSELAATTLRALGERQGSRRDDFRDEDPGRIMHEQRFGEMTAFEERPHSPYYGTADATPLYVVLLDEYERWTGDVELVKRLEHECRAAITWIDTYGDLMGNGYISYKRRNEATGLENQCWKDSWDSISFRNGDLPGFPRATCELQGYAYDAKTRAARLARSFWQDPGYAEQLEEQAADLKRRFNRDFWVEDGEYFALALDPEGRKVDSLTSNIGHLLWSGIVEDDKAAAIARHLMSDELFSGWGIRTMATSEARYNPVGYHVGTVWPFDNSIIAWGLRRYGFKDEAARVAAGILDAATYFDGRLPEAFGGYPRSETLYPVQYPTACSPQAWSTGAPLLLLRTMLGLEPVNGHLLVDPAVPSSIARIELLDIPGRWERIDAFARGRVQV